MARGSASEGVDLVEAIGFVTVGVFGSREFAEGGEEIDGGNQRLPVDLSGGDLPRPAGQEGYIDASFKRLHEILDAKILECIPTLTHIAVKNIQQNTQKCQ